MQEKEENPLAHLAAWALEALSHARVAHLACATTEGKPLVVPICFTFDGTFIYSAIDEKPKKSLPLELRRATNISQNPNVCFIIDDYAEDWKRLRYVLIDGTASIQTKGKQAINAISLLREKYVQYEDMNLEEDPIIKITPRHVAAWSGAG